MALFHCSVLTCFTEANRLKVCNLVLPESPSKGCLFWFCIRNAHSCARFSDLGFSFLWVYSYLILLKRSFFPHVWTIFSCYHCFYIYYWDWMKRREINTVKPVYCKLQINTHLEPVCPSLKYFISVVRLYMIKTLRTRLWEYALNVMWPLTSDKL